MTEELKSVFRSSRRTFSLALALLVSACASDSPTRPDEGDALFLIRACRGSDTNPQGETFRLLVRDEAVARQAESLIGVPLGDPRQRLVTGAVRRGNGGFNASWSWHIDPTTVAFVEVAIELCDGCPSMVESNLDAWMSEVGQYCPWSTEVLGRER